MLQKFGTLTSSKDASGLDIVSLGPKLPNQEHQSGWVARIGVLEIRSFDFVISKDQRHIMFGICSLAQKIQAF